MDFPDIGGWMSPGERNWLYERAKEMRSIVEVGSWKGRSTYALLSGCPGTVYAVDTWKGSPDEINSSHKEATQHDIYDDFIKNVGHFRNLVAVRKDSVEASKEIPTVDMVFIDGCHQYDAVKHDIAAWLPKTVKLICGHDKNQAGVPAAVKEAFGDTESVETIWFVRLKEKTMGINETSSNLCALSDSLVEKVNAVDQKLIALLPPHELMVFQFPGENQIKMVNELNKAEKACQMAIERLNWLAVNLPL